MSYCRQEYLTNPNLSLDTQGVSLGYLTENSIVGVFGIVVDFNPTTST